ncbi:MAG: alpha/beta family hydrolase [Bacteroidota bacterium]
MKAGGGAPVLLLAPGAGAGSSSAWMQSWRRRLAAVGDVETFDYPYRLRGRKAPDKLPVLIDAHREALRTARSQHPRAAGVVLAGKSMGGRVGCHLALEEPVDALICLGYPLRGASGALRDEVLLALRTPVLFVQGTRDPLCPLDALADVRKRMSAPHQLFVVEGGNHSLEVRRGRGTKTGTSTSARDPAADDGAPVADPQEESDARVLRAIAAFVAGVLPG